MLILIVSNLVRDLMLRLKQLYYLYESRIETESTLQKQWFFRLRVLLRTVYADPCDRF